MSKIIYSGSYLKEDHSKIYLNYLDAFHWTMEDFERWKNATHARARFYIIFNSKDEIPSFVWNHIDEFQVKQWIGDL